MNAANRRSRWLVIGVLICILLVGALIVSAQSTPPSIPIGENQTNSLTDASSSVQFSIAVSVPQNVNVQILATSPEFAPAFRVLDPNNAVVLDVANSDARSIIQGALTLSSFGTYILEVRSANDTGGQFTISLQPGAPLAPPTPLPLQQLVTTSVDTQTTRQAFSFTALSTDALLLDVTSSSPTSSPVIHLSDADTGNTLGLSNAQLTSVRFRMPIGSTHYLLEVTTNGSNSPQSVTICLWAEHSVSPCPGVGSGITSQNSTSVGSQDNSNGACTCDVTATSAANVNIRVAPSLAAAVIGHLPPGTPAQVIGELPNHLWVEINYNGVIGWVAAAVVTIDNSCPGIQVITPTPPPGLPTSTATPVRGGLPTIPARPGPLNTPTPQTNPTNPPPPPPTNPPPPPPANPTPTPVIGIGVGATNTPPPFQLQTPIGIIPATPTPTHILIR